MRVVRSGLLTSLQFSVFCLDPLFPIFFAGILFHNRFHFESSQHWKVWRSLFRSMDNVSLTHFFFSQPYNRHLFLTPPPCDSHVRLLLHTTRCLAVPRANTYECSLPEYGDWYYLLIAICLLVGSFVSLVYSSVLDPGKAVSVSEMKER